MEDKVMELLIRIDERLKGIKDGDNGDIPEIKEHLRKFNNKMGKHERRITRLEVIVYLVAGGGVVGGGIGKLLGLY